MTTATVSSARVHPGLPLTWEDITSMFGSVELTGVLKNLAPLTEDEVFSIYNKYQTVSVAGSDLLPKDGVARQKIIRSPMIRLASEASAGIMERDRAAHENGGGFVPRDVMGMVYELIVSMGGPEKLASRDGWLWGPTGPPIRSNAVKNVKKISRVDIYAKHAQNIGCVWDANAKDKFEDDSNQTFRDLLEQNLETLLNLETTCELLTTAYIDYQEVKEESMALAVGVVTRSDKERLRELSEQAWFLTNYIKGATYSVLRASVCITINNALEQIPGIESRAMRIIESIAFVQGLMTHWESLTQQQTDSNLSYWELKNEPLPADFWLGAFIAARFQLGIAVDGIKGLANVLLERTDVSDEEEQALKKVAERYKQ